MQKPRKSSPRIDLVGKRFGKLTVESWAGMSRWNCICECGGRTIVYGANLNRKNTRSCGCIKRIASSKRATKHGLYNTNIYRTWLGVRRRCFDKNFAPYKDYGARGISMFSEWKDDVVKFRDYLGDPPTPGHSLDRIDNTKGYFPGNVRWADAYEQANNRTNNRVVIWRGDRYTLAQLARKIADECNIPHKRMMNALSNQVHGVGATTRADDG